MRKRKVIGLVAAALATVMLMPGIAGAAKPETRTITFNNGGVVFENRCGEGVDLVFISSEGQVRLTDFFDSDGVQVRTHSRVTVDVVYSLSNTEETLSAKGQYSGHIDTISGESAFTGLTFKINVPGEGGVYRDVGQQVFDGSGEKIFVAGQDSPTGSLDFVCNYLG